ncbi:MAG TPA: hypothetical protein PLV68_14075 [Ilumatobacteraceae bacterium]|nr:hypothetical protein [Ilumatobacteraceae bacterium]
MTDIHVSRETFQVENRSWLLGPTGTRPGENPSITLDISTFTPGVHYPNGYIPSGTALGRLTANGKYGPYSGTTEEVQSITVGGSGLTSFTLTFSGQTTSSLAAAATAEQVQLALEALSNIGAGNITVTGPAGGPWIATFVGGLADTNVAQMTSTPTGGSGTVTVATVQAGGVGESADGRETAAMLLFSSVKVPDLLNTAIDVGAAGFVTGFVSLSRLPFALDANGQADLAHIVFSD